MTLIYSVILCLLLKARSCKLQCVKETPNDAEFSINVTTHIKAEYGSCIWIPYEFTFPTDKVTIPYSKIWFKGDPQNGERIEEVVNDVKSETKDVFMIDGLPYGEYEYGFKLEWECNQTYIFPKRVRISVSALTKGPAVFASPMTEGESDRLRCNADRFCVKRPSLHWEWTKADGQLVVLLGDNFMLNDEDIFLLHHEIFLHHDANTLNLTPTEDDHNTNISCVADYGYGVVKTTITLTVKFAPKILNGSQCTLEGKLLVCLCISQGNPLPPITWPLASLTDFTVTSSSSIQTVSSTITMPAADNHTSVKCISSNEVGQTEIDIPIQNYRRTSVHGFGAALPWIAAVSFSLNVGLLIALIICTHKRRKSTQKKHCEEVETYASLNRTDVEQEYSVISPQCR